MPRLPLELPLPGCKSLSQRALLLAAVAEGRSRLRGVSPCDDSRHLRAALAGLGARCEQQGDALAVTGLGGPPRTGGEVDVGEAGSSLRFLLPLCAAGRGPFRITGTPRLMERPHQPLLDALAELGCSVRRVDGARPGFELDADGLPAGDWPAPAAVSSQFLSGLALAAAAGAGARFRVPASLPSPGYFALTLEAVRAFAGDAGIAVTDTGGGASVVELRPGPPRGRSWEIPGDPSGATFLLVALVLTGAAARIAPDWSATHPEAGLLRQFEEHKLLARKGTVWTPTGQLPDAPLRIDLDPAPDAGPGLAVLGAHLPHGLALHGVARLRAKESDRVAGIQRLLRCAGQRGRLEGEVLHVPGGGIRSDAHGGAPFDPDQDHRLAMAAGLVRLHAPGLRIADPDCVAKSFPTFWEVIGRLPSPAETQA